MFKTILVPTDGSAHAARAVAIASDLAAKHEARMILLHVVSDDAVPEELARFAENENLPKTRAVGLINRLEATPHGPLPVPGGVRDRVDHSAVMFDIAERLLVSASGIAKQRGVKEVDVMTEQGDPAERILESARREHAEGIVMGSRGLGGLKGAIIGSVSHKVCHKADCTCITVT